MEIKVICTFEQTFEVPDGIKIDTPDFKLKGNQEFALNWLIERIQIIINSNYRPEDVRKFFLVWAEVHYMFWW